MKAVIRIFLLCVFIVLTSSVYGQHLVYLSNDAITGNGAPAYGYSQFFSKTNNYLYVCNGNQIVIFTATIANDPVFNRNFTGGIYWNMVIDGNYSYIAANTNGVRDYDMNTAIFPRPSFIGSVPTANDAANIAKVGDYIYVARGFYGLGTVNVTNPATPVLVNTYTDGAANWNSVTANSNIIAASRDGGFRTFTRVDPAQPQAAVFVPLSATPTQLHLAGNRLFLQVSSGADSGISIYDVATPSNPILLARTNRATTTYLVDGNYLYAATSQGGNLSRIYSYSIANLPTVAVIDSFTQNLGQVLNMYRENAVMHAIRFDGSQRDMMTFDILGEVTLTTPNGFDTLYTGDNAIIQWQSNRTPGIARIELNRNYPTGEWEYVADAAFTDGQYTWPVAGPITSNAKFRIRSLQYSIISDESDDTFAIIDRSISYTSPAAGSTRYIGDSDTIRWSHVGLTGSVTLALNTSYPSGTWIDLGTTDVTNGSFAWTINTIATTTARYRVTSQNYPTLSDMTAGDFTVSNRTITVLYPNGGENLYIQDTATFRWSSQNVTGNVVVELNRSYPSGTYSTLATVPVEQGQISWPVTSPSTSTARIRVRSVNYPI
ncbi:MAG: hypothetical protein OEM52_07495, partial [bacterium]|nr:hypothetical protein [bacterium]